MYVLIIGGRYGSEISETKKASKKDTKSFYERYESITKREYASANSKKVPIYILIERSVYSEYQTYRHNRSNESVTYAHVDSVNIFSFIDEILGQPFNNPVQTFEKFSDIDVWLRDQWAGLFRDLLNRRSEQSQLSSLSNEVKQLGELNTTLKRYMETLLKASKQPGSEQVIQQEDKRLDEARIRGELQKTDLFQVLELATPFPADKILGALLKSNTLDELTNTLFPNEPHTRNHIVNDSTFKRQYEEVHKILNRTAGDTGHNKK